MRPDALPTRLPLALMLIGGITVAIIVSAPPAAADDPLARIVGDGQPWEMYVVKRKASNILVFRADGTGVVSDSLANITVTWRSVEGGICIKPQGQDAERCHILTRTKEGIAASQNGTTVFVLRR